jgi:UDP-glucose 4-epimerase
VSEYLVTGGAGFIGSHITEALVQRGQRVRVLDNLSTGRLDALKGCLSQIAWIEGDVRDPAVVRPAVEGVDVVFHQAALASMPRSVADPMSTHEVCVTGTLRVLIAAREAGVRRVVYAASSSAYGNAPQLPKRESQPPEPASPYAAAKLAGEHYCEAFTAVYGLETVRLRYFNVFGPGQDPSSPYSAVIPLFVTAMLGGRRPTVYGDGTQSRDFTFISDVVAANLLAADAPAAAGNVYNVASGRAVSLLKIITLLNQFLDTKVEPAFESPRPGDVKHSLADLSRAKADLGYVAQVGFEEGLRRSIDYYRTIT